MFGNSIGSANNGPIIAPVSTSLPTMGQWNNQQMAQMMNMATKGKENIAESNRLIERLDKNEAEQLVKDQEFIEAKNIYEQAFMGFLSAKFTDEFLMSKNGEEASQILLDTTKKLMDKVNYAAREKQRKFDRLMEALEKNPELAKQLEINT